MSGIFLNFSECKMEIETVVVFKTEFIGKEWFGSIKKSNPDFTFYRKGSIVFFWNSISENSVKNIGTKYSTIQISLSEHPKIFSKMLEDKIVQMFFNNKNVKVQRNKYSNTWEFINNKDLFGDDGLNVNRAVNFSSYYSRVGDKVSLGYCLSTRLKNYFKWGRKEFYENGISFDDLAGKEDIIFSNKTAVKRYLEARGLDKKYNSMSVNENKLDKEFEVISKTMEWIAKKLVNTQLYKGITIKECTFKYLPYDNNQMECSVIQKPKRYYANDKEGTKGRYDEQLKSLSPYSVANFTAKKINIIVITPKMYEGTVSDFIKKLKANLASVFKLNYIFEELILVDGNSLNDYEKAMYERKFSNIDLAIVIVSESQIPWSINKSPYYFCKAKYIGQGIPTQEIKIENLKSSGLDYIISNVSLNIYAKLGGTPWGIEKTEHLKKEFIIGIGSSVNELKKMVLGIANIFDYTGKYFVGDCIPLSGFEEYAEKLEDVLYEKLRELIGEHCDEVRLVFHIFKSPSNRYEIKALTNIINRFQGIVIKYAFVHLAYGHNFRLFNNDGKANVEKGFYINISENEALINFIDKSSIPLRITVDRRSNFHDVYHLAKQIYWFSHLSFRSYLPAKKSVSIIYPSLMAKMTERLKKVDGWDYNILKTVGDKLWFI